ncbi:MAG: tetratricopeptide repeat-containing sulfotransferase family protein [Luteimonas sp.]
MNNQTQDLLRKAATLHRHGRRAEAIDTFRQVLANKPELGEGWYELGCLLKAEGRYMEALDAYGQALAHGIERPEQAHLNRGVIYSDHLRRDGDAECELQSAIALAPDYVPALLNLGNLHEERGQGEQALACYDRVLGDAGTVGDPQDLRSEALARSAKLRPPTSIDDPLFARLHEAVAAQSDKAVRANLLFALGQAYDRLGQFDLAFDAFAKANRWLLRQSGRHYNRIRATQRTETLIEAFETASTSQSVALVDAGVRPVFICGMFRSGSTLVEQVLATHPQVTAGGELDYLKRLAAGPLAPFPASMSVADAALQAKLADDYRAHLLRLFPEAASSTYITDKRPDNFVLIGLIKRLFPAARIIHTIRNPLDNGMSIFMQHLNPQVAGYSCDLGEIGHYYGQYRRLMAHWKTIYANSIYDFDYDAFVTDPKPALERLFDFLELPWDDRCLEFHRLGNTVKTASYWQVRQPLYSNASGRWRNYDAHLNVLRQSLCEAGIRLDDVARTA